MMNRPYRKEKRLYQKLEMKTTADKGKNAGDEGDEKVRWKSQVLETKMSQ